MDNWNHSDEPEVNHTIGPFKSNFNVLEVASLQTYVWLPDSYTHMYMCGCTCLCEGAHVVLQPLCRSQKAAYGCWFSVHLLSPRNWTQYALSAEPSGQPLGLFHSVAVVSSHHWDTLPEADDYLVVSVFGLSVCYIYIFFCSFIIYF